MKVRAAALLDFILFLPRDFCKGLMFCSVKQVASPWMKMPPLGRGEKPGE